MSRKFYIQTKQKSCFPLDTWMTKLEMRAFGWKCKGDHVEYEDAYDIEIDLDNNTAKANRRFNVYTTFKRIKPYGNFLLKMWELFMTIQSWIRLKLEFILFVLVIIALVIGLIDTFLLGGSGDGKQGFFYALYIVLFIYAPSLFYALMGFLTRVVFRLDKKLKNQLEKNGYSREQDI